MVLNLVHVQKFHWQLVNVDKNIVIFRVENRSSRDIGNRKKDVLVLGEGFLVTVGLNDTAIKLM